MRKQGLGLRLLSNAKQGTSLLEEKVTLQGSQPTMQGRQAQPQQNPAFLGRRAAFFCHQQLLIFLGQTIPYSPLTGRMPDNQKLL